jgi:hypothetical protein
VSGTHIALAIVKKKVKELEVELESLQAIREEWLDMWSVLESLNLTTVVKTYMRGDTDISEAIDEVTA